METLLTSRDARELLGLPTSTFSWWVRQGVVHPVVPGRGKGATQVFTTQQIWAIGIAKSIKAGGQSLEIACEAANVLESLTPQQIEDAFAEGKTCLLVMSVDGQLQVAPFLLSPSAITDNPHFEKLRADAVAKGLTVQFYGIDTKPMLDQIIGKLEHETKSKKKRTGKRGATRKRS